MFEQKKLDSIVKRVAKANGAMAVMGAMMLSIEIDQMTKDQKMQIFFRCFEKKVSTKLFPELDKAVQ